MDAKSLARSKRAHSQQLNKKHHPNPKSKASAVSSSTEGNASKPSGKQTGQKPRQAHASSSSSKLPSNWDRYGEEMGVDSEGQSVSNTATNSDVVLPKSKGADFSWLVSEAKSQSSSSLGFFPSLQDVLPDIDQAVSSMLSVRGKGILSWIGDDNFIVDDDANAGYEASFLSMDLHALAAELEKINISRRLFIEEDLLPPELCAGGSSDITTKELEKAETAGSELANRRSDESAVHGHADVNQESNAMPPSATSSDSDSSVPIFRSSQTTLANPLKDDSDQFHDTDLTSILDSVEPFNDIPIAVSSEKNSTFEALAAEAELDMLLNSFGETSLLDSSNINKNSTSISPFPPKGDSSSFLGGFTAANSSSEPSVQITNSTKMIPKMVNLNDSIDDILAQTSNSMNQKNGGILLQGVTTNPLDVPSLSTSSTGSKALEDFESWLDTI